jgi:cellulose synthase/poly-beta-1,6-N-acetylglucosamine synthase-like glycosyltransferase
MINLRVAEFAWRVKNWARPLGLKALGSSCQLMGTGMAFPWDVISTVDLASGLIVEDLKLGLDLALSGASPIFYPVARVTSFFPSSVAGVQSQRLRWERGHVGMILSSAPRLILAALVKRNVDLLALALDLTVPPLTLLALLSIVIWLVTGMAALLGASSTALFISSTTLVGFVGAVFACWLKYARDILPPRSFALIGSYITNKLPLYRTILSRKSASQWTRTDRKK